MSYGYSSLTNVKKWILQNGFFIKNGDDRPYTHLLLDGGKIHIPYKRLTEFRRKYAASIYMGEKNYMCECRTNIFKFFVDLDFEDTEKVPDDVMKQYVIDIQHVLVDFFKNDNNPEIQDSDFTVLVATTTTKNITKNGKDYIKTACHPIWPKLYVNQKVAMIIRKALIQFFESKYGERHPDNLWKDVFDPTVYTSNGLRMIGSYKMSWCKVCNRGRNKDDFCELCFGNGKIHENRTYMVTDVLDLYGNSNTDYLQQLEKDIVQMVTDSSIVTDLNYMVHSLPEEYPEWYDPNKFEFDDTATLKTKAKKAYPFGNRRTPDDELGAKELNLRKPISANDDKFKKLERFIKNTMPDVYKNIAILDVHICNDGDEYYYVARTNSRFCMNVSRHHNSSTIFFLINRYGVYQKCFCRKETTNGRKFGICKKYASQRRPLTEEIRRLFFPNYRNSNAVLCEVPTMKHTKATNEQDQKNLDKSIQKIDNFIYYLTDIIIRKGDFEDNTFNSKRHKTNKSHPAILY